MPRRFTEEKRKGLKQLIKSQYTYTLLDAKGVKKMWDEYGTFQDLAKDAIADLDDANARLEKAKELLEEWAQPPEIPYPYNKYVDRQTRTKAFLAKDKDEAKPESKEEILPYLLEAIKSVVERTIPKPEAKQECSCWLKENFNDMVLIEKQSQKTGEWLLRFKPFSGFKIEGSK